MLHTKFQCHQLSSSKFLRRRFSKVFTIYGHGSQLGHYEQTFVPPFNEGSTCNLVSTGLEISEEMLFENVDTDADDRPLPVL